MSATVLNEAEGLIQIILALYLINTKFEPGLYGSHAKLMRLIAPAGVYLVTRIPYYLLPALWQPIAFLPVLFAYLLLCREGRLGPFLLWSVLSVALLQAVGALYNLFALYAFGLTRAGMAARPIIEQSQFLVGRAFLSGLAFYIVSRIGKRDQGALPVPRPAVALMVILPVLSIGVMLALDMESIAGQSAQNASSAAQQDSSLHILILAASLGVLCLNIIVVAIYNILSAQAEKLAGQEELRQRESMLRQHSDEIRTLYAEMRTWRHDFRNHLHALHGLLESARYGAAGEYLDSIESSVEKIEQLIHTGNDTLDAILNAKISLARAMQIDLETEVRVPEQIKMEPIDLCSLVGNLMDNALEACNKITTPEEGRFIHLRVAAVKGQLYIEVENSTDGSVKTKDGRFLTTKDRRFHGVGLRQIDAIARKYNGYSGRSFEGNVFSTVVSLPVCYV